MPAVEPRISPCWRNSQAPRIQGSTAEPPGRQPSLRLPITPISPPIQWPSPVRQAPPIPSPAWTRNSFAKTRSWISRFPAARADLEAVADKAADKAAEREAEVEAVSEVEAVEVVSEAEAVEVGDAAAGE